MFKQLFANTGALSRFIWRRDRIRISLWVAGLSIGSIIIGMMYPELFPAELDRHIMAETMQNPAMVAMFGPVYGLDDYHVAAVFSNQMLLFTALTFGIMNILLVTAHTRHDEENGRIEMFRSLPVGRLSSAASSLLVMTMVNIILAVIIGFGLAAPGIESMDLAGSLTYGGALAAAGIFFAAATALFAQLSDTSRGTIGYSFAFLGLIYIVRGIGDISSEALSLITPLGLINRAQPYVGNHWWPLLVTLALSGLVAVVVLRLNAVRDLEAGLIPAKPGPKNASGLLRGPFGLALRLQKTPIIGWAVGMFIFGASYGSIFGDIEKFFETSDFYQQLLPSIEGFSLTEQFVAMIISMLAIIGAIPAILMIMKLRGEETANRTEHLLARAVPRIKIMGGYLMLGILVAAAMQVLTALGLWSAAASVMDEPLALGPILQGALAYLPAMLIMVGLAALLVGVAPGVASVCWIYLAFTFFAVYLGAAMQIPEWIGKLTPFGHIPNVPMEEVSSVVIIISVVLALVLMVLGFVGYRRRDIHG